MVVSYERRSVSEQIGTKILIHIELWKTKMSFTDKRKRGTYLIVIEDTLKQ